MNICYSNPRFIKEFDALVKQHSLSECVLNEIANDDDPSECATDYYAEYDKRIHTRKKLEVVSSMEVLLDFLNFETLKEFCKEKLSFILYPKFPTTPSFLYSSFSLLSFIAEIPSVT